MPDLEILKVTAIPERRELEATIRNAGTAKATATKIQMYSQTMEPLAEAVVEALEQDHSVSVKIGPIALPIEGTLRVDDPAIVDEADETNNAYDYP